MTVRAFEIEGLLDQAPEGIEVLSLDCFDTLIWRNTHAPSDVFAEIDMTGGAVEPRSWAEGNARRRAMARSGAKEIGLTDIYREMLAHASEDEVEAAVTHELTLEARHAFAFGPVVALMREARRRGLKIVIVSDMYLTEPQLRAHIGAAAGEDVMALIDQVFVSSAYGEGKRDGLFDHVIEALGVAPDRILHIGDNRAADYDAAIEHGLHAVHLAQFDAESASRLRMEAATARILDPLCGISRPIAQAHRAAVAMRTCNEPTYVLGHDIMGPAMATYAHWLKAEIDTASKAAGKPVKPLFVMRDGYLPHKVFDALYPEVGARTVDLSRFVALRASIKDEASLGKHLDEWSDTLPLPSLARQLMLFENEYARFAKAGSAETQSAALAKWVRGNSDIQRKIFTRREAFLKRLVAHMNHVGIAPGDTVMLVDTGYNGTVQNLVTPILAETMGVSVMGRYVFLREKRRSGLDKRGMIDVRNYDYRTLHALSLSIVSLEQLCNVSQGSTIDFTATGEAIREKLDRKATHNATRDAVQAACMDYVRAAGNAVLKAPEADDLDSRCRAATAILARLSFLPNAGEVSVFERFDFDYNMGLAHTETLVDTDRGRNGLRRRGLTFYNDQRPQFLSAELQAQGLSMSLANFATSRFKLDLRSTDFEVGGIQVPVILAGAAQQGVMEFTAWPTAEGYYQLRVPVGEQRPVIAVQLGQTCEWVQVEEFGFIPLENLKKGQSAATVAAKATADAMEQMSPGLFRASPTGVLIAAPPEGSEPMVLSLVFRPVVARAATVQLRAAA
ncbi:hydrolase [Sphingomonas sp. HITSZ_GF]|uniref:HAD family hydrolase n=1 Tax=Sphingomonas sp. HITSZ_GF TaxID=3037247 RepID=UPI00240DF9FA|nr:HAD family hydrolase [Sphingomonas sp. HITSZ_GF]MDG2534819.1 hydrolase [Sphingomonas sp. HITSZ_GF]